jgi:hypothetical protein
VVGDRRIPRYTFDIIIHGSHDDGGVTLSRFVSKAPFIFFSPLFDLNLPLLLQVSIMVSFKQNIKNFKSFIALR